MTDPVKRLPRETRPAVDFVRKICLPQKFCSKLPGIRPDTLDWDWAAHYATNQGLAPAFFYNLTILDKKFSRLPAEQACLSTATGPWGVAPDLISLLQDSYLSTLRGNLRTQAVLTELDVALGSAGCNCIAWKGASLMIDAYPDLGLRPMDDIDLIVPAEQMANLKTILKCLGFKDSPHYPMTWHRGGITLDLHHDAVHSDRIPGRLKAISLTFDKLMRNAAPLKGFNYIFTPAPHDALICGAVHALKHDFAMEIWLLDTVYMINRYPEILADLDTLIKRAKDYNATVALYALFMLLGKWPLNQHFGFVDRLRPEKPGPVYRLFLTAFKKGRTVPHAGEVFFFFLQNSVRNKIRFMLQTLFPSRQVMRQLFPDKSALPSWAFYPLRFYRLIKMGMTAVSQVLFPKSGPDDIGHR